MENVRYVSTELFVRERELSSCVLARVIAKGTEMAYPCFEGCGSRVCLPPCRGDPLEQD